MASFPSGLSFRVLLHDSREISRRHRRKRKYSSSSIKSCVYSRMFSWLKILASNEKRRFNPKIWKTGEIVLLWSRHSLCLSKMYLRIMILQWQMVNNVWKRKMEYVTMEYSQEIKFLPRIACVDLGQLGI